jgi:hypothetical protein
VRFHQVTYSGIACFLKASFRPANTLLSGRKFLYPRNLACHDASDGVGPTFRCDRGRSIADLATAPPYFSRLRRKANDNRGKKSRCIAPSRPCLLLSAWQCRPLRRCSCTGRHSAAGRCAWQRRFPAEREAAIKALVASGNPKVSQILQLLSDGQLYAPKTAARFFCRAVDDEPTYSDPMSGEAAATWIPTS